MERPNRKQWVVLWCGVVWTIGSVVIAEDYLFRALLAGFVVTALLFWQLSNDPHANQPPHGVVPTSPPVTPDYKPEVQQPLSVGPSSPAQSGASPPAAPAPQREPCPSGVGGWLILIVLGALLSPPLTIYVVCAYAEVWTDPWFFTLAIAGGILSGWTLFVALGLLNRWPRAPKLAQIQLFSLWCFSTSLEVLAATTAGMDFSKSLPPLIGSTFGTVLWMKYFNQSRRVRATYGPMPPGPITAGQARMMGFAAGILATFLAVGIADSRRQSWAKFRSDDGHYEVEAPGTARPTTLKDGAIQQAFGNDVRGFVVLDSAFVAENTNTQSYLEAVRNNVVTNLKGSVIRTSSVNLDGNPGIEFSATFPYNGNTGDLRGRIYLAKSDGFLLLVSGPGGGRTT